ncbi:hypothetical protein PIIN_05882 [Serendipita indica DSM 11827]|uniref:Uncharacterized protein n=1 Tax=Serendipita indica (strain DSM 11827) TaxID=1109443 RepID=G4TKV4_SERID|nr:hypothetical protein PIIN_05882 [Serendipita indica DSM 11827]
MDSASQEHAERVVPRAALAREEQIPAENQAMQEMLERAAREDVDRVAVVVAELLDA